MTFSQYKRTHSRGWKQAAQRLCLLFVAHLLFTAGGFEPPASADTQKKSSTSSPTTFLKNLYRAHDNRKGPFFEKTTKQSLAKYFDSKLTELIWKDATETPKDMVGRLDFDPFYYTQDPLITDFKIGEPKITQNKAVVVVRFKNTHKPQSITYHLRKTGDGWKIQNLYYPDGDNLIKILSMPIP